MFARDDAFECLDSNKTFKYPLHYSAFQRKSLQILYSKLLYKMHQDFLDIQYTY